MSGPRVWRDTDPIQAWLRAEYTLPEEEVREKQMERISTALDMAQISKAERFLLLTYHFDCECGADYAHLADFMGMTVDEMRAEVARISTAVKKSISLAA